MRQQLFLLVRLLQLADIVDLGFVGRLAFGFCVVEFLSLFLKGFPLVRQFLIRSGVFLLNLLSFGLSDLLRVLRCLVEFKK